MADYIILQITFLILKCNFKSRNRNEFGFPTRQNSATFQDKGTEVPSLSQDKRTSSKSCQGMGRDGLGQPVKIRDGMRDGKVQDFDSLSCPVSKTKRDIAEKDILKQEKDVLKQKRTF